MDSILEGLDVFRDLIAAGEVEVTNFHVTHHGCNAGGSIYATANTVKVWKAQ